MKKQSKILIVLAVLAGIFGATVVDARPPVDNGVLREYFDNKKLRLEIVRKNGQTVRRRNFYRSGRLLQEDRYKNGKMYLKRSFYANGKLKSFWTKKSGKTKFYHRDGSFRLEVDRPGGN